LLSKELIFNYSTRPKEINYLKEMVILNGIFVPLMFLNIFALFSNAFAKYFLAL
jgi:hypothetical protein